MIDLTAFQRDIVRILYHQKEMIGLELKSLLEDERNSDVNHGRLYPNLDNLREKGYIRKTEKDGRSNNYDLTSEGIDLYEAHIDRIVHGE